MSLNNDQLVAILQSTINDLVELGAGSDYLFDDHNARAIAEISSCPTHRAKFFIANRRINQLTGVIEKLRRPRPNYRNHEF